MGYSYSSGVGTGVLLGLISTFWLLAVAWIVLKIVARWRIFVKAGQPGWASIVPFYSSYVEYKIYWGNGLLFLVPLILTLLGFIPFIGTLLIIISAVIGFITKYKQAVAFGQGIGFTIGLILLTPIFNMILAFGQYQYLGIPQDGYSYTQIKEKYDTYQQSHPAQQPTYQQPSQSTQQNVEYQQPAAPQQNTTNYQEPAQVQTQPPAAPDQNSNSTEQ